MAKRRRMRYGGYRLDALIRRGGQGEVWSAANVQSGSLVAIKIIPRHPIDRGDKRFQRELKALGQLAHPNIVGLLEVSPDDDNDLWYAMEIAAGSLRDCMGKGIESWPVRDRLHGLHQAAVGMAYAHEQGFIHRDLKPDNILCVPVPSGAAFKVSDFGAVKLVLPDTTTTITTSRSVVGTMAYWSPEHARDPSAVDARSDVYSFGVIVYEMLTGEQPLLQGRSASDVAADTEEQYRPMLKKMLAPVPGKRFQTMLEVVQALEKWIPPDEQPILPATLIDRASALHFETRAAALFLTARERQVVKLVMEGHSNADIAERLGVVPLTVSMSLSRVYRRVGGASGVGAKRATLRRTFQSPYTGVLPEGV